MQNIILNTMLAIALLSSFANAKQITDEEIKIIGKAASLSLGRTLIGKMKKEMKKSNKTSMVVFCQEQAESITNGVNKLLPDGITVKRVSKKYRNILNKPNSTDLEAINYFKDLKKKGQNLKKKIKIIKTSTGYTYYATILITKKCIPCHSHLSKMNSDIKKTIDALFPNDLAHGYKVGDLRGLFAVEIDTNIYR